MKWYGERCQTVHLTLKWTSPHQKLVWDCWSMMSGLVWIYCRELSHPVPSHMFTVREAGCNYSPVNRVAIPPCSTLLHGGTDIFIAILLYLFSGLDLLLWSTNPAQPPAAESSLLGSKIPQGKRQGIHCGAWLYFIERTSDRYKQQNRNRNNSNSSVFVLCCCAPFFFR